MLSRFDSCNPRTKESSSPVRTDSTRSLDIDSDSEATGLRILCSGFMSFGVSLLVYVMAKPVVAIPLIFILSVVDDIEYASGFNILIWSGVIAGFAGVRTLNYLLPSDGLGAGLFLYGFLLLVHATLSFSVSQISPSDWPNFVMVITRFLSFGFGMWLANDAVFSIIFASDPENRSE